MKNHYWIISFLFLFVAVLAANIAAVIILEKRSEYKALKATNTTK